MKVKLHINYHTEWGENLYVYGDIRQLGSGDPREALPMHPEGVDLWALELELPDDTPDFTYSFVVKAPEREWRFEWGGPHMLRPNREVAVFNVFDSWEGMPSDKPYYSSAFIDGMLGRPGRAPRPVAEAGTVNFRIYAPMTSPDEVVAVSGECDAMGRWDVRKAIRLSDADYPLWQCNVPMEGCRIPFEYKFLIVSKVTGEVRLWEERDNRVFGIRLTAPKEQIVIDGLRFADPRRDWKGAGTAIPVFSIRTEEDFGVGDFTDIMKMADWCAETGQKVLQVLPINDTVKTGTWTDSYPYSANSSFALHPMYIRPDRVGRLTDRARVEYFREEGDRLNSLPQIDYEAVVSLKDRYMREIYAQDGAATAGTPGYRSFVEKNSHWLRPYAAWCVLRDLNGTADNTRWGELAEYDETGVEAFIAAHRNEVEYYCFVQYHLDRQLREAVDHAHARGVVLKGDIPIGVGRQSVDTWQNPRLFNMDCQAGAPPDDFSVLGQNWGFPTYNWEEMARDGFGWWKARFRKMSEYFDLYRIDHILGFFRIWQIPMDAVHGLLGYFNPALPFTPGELKESYDFWIDPDVQARPLILDWMLTDFFGETAEEARRTYLERVGGDRYRLRDFVDTQKKVVGHFAGMEKNEVNRRLEDGLLGLIDNVLFIEDPYEKGTYHPRISAQFSYQYRCLSDYERWCFNRLYNDFFYRRHNDFWYGKAMWKLPPILDATKMLTCGEDLGMIPDCVPEVMRRLQILSLEIQRMPKDPKAEFGDTWHYPYYSVCTTSTHDMGGIRAWWESDPAQSQRYFNTILHEGGQAPFYAEPWICDRIVGLQLASPSMLCILPLQDWLSTDGGLRRENPADEQINDPANPQHYWRYRMHLTMQQLRDAADFNKSLRSKIYEARR